VPYTASPGPEPTNFKKNKRAKSKILLENIGEFWKKWMSKSTVT